MPATACGNRSVSTGHSVRAAGDRWDQWDVCAMMATHELIAVNPCWNVFSTKGAATSIRQDVCRSSFDRRELDVERAAEKKTHAGGDSEGAIRIDALNVGLVAVRVGIANRHGAVGQPDEVQSQCGHV